VADTWLLRPRAAARLAGGFALALLVGCAVRSTWPSADLSPPLRTARAPDGSVDSSARWVPVSGPTSFESVLPEGVLLLVGGRRALVRADGRPYSPSQADPEPLRGIVSVPTRDGARLFGYATHTIYRFDGPLGRATAFVSSVPVIRVVGAGPGCLFVTVAEGDEPLILDPDSGAEVRPEGWPEAPMRTALFRSAQPVQEAWQLFWEEGIVDFSTIGPMATIDGGKTFHPTRADWWRRGMTTDVPRGSPTLQWIAATHRDPVEAAVEHGIVAESGDSAIIEGAGLLAYVDLATGTVTKVLEHGGTRCAIARQGSHGLLLCPNSRAQAFPLDGTLRLDRLNDSILPDTGVTNAIVGAAGGGLLIPAPCSAAAPVDSICALQPDGRFASIVLPAFGKPRPASWRPQENLGALPDGRAALLVPGEESRRVRPHLSVVDQGGVPFELPALPLPEGVPTVDGLGSIVLGTDGALHGLVASVGTDPTVYAIRQQLDGSRATAVDLHVPMGMARAGYALAWSATALRVSRDAGQTWMKLSDSPPSAQVPSLLMRGVGPGASALLTRTIDIGEVGLRLGGYARIGWGPSAPLVAVPPPVARITLHPHDTRVKHRSFACSSTITARSAPALDYGQRVALFAAATGASPPHGRRDVADRLGTSDEKIMRALGWFDVPLARLESSAAMANAPRPERWTIRWLDPLEEQSRIHVWTGPASPGANWESYIASIATAHGWTAFSIFEHGESDLLVVSPEGEARSAHLETVLSDLVLDEEGDLLGQSSTSRRLVLWRPGEKPRPIALWGGQASRLIIGEPARDSVPVLISNDLHAWARAIPFGSPSTSPMTLPVAGWTRVEADPESFAVCRLDAGGYVFQMPSVPDLRVDLDGTTVSATVRFEARIQGDAPCLSGMRGWLERPPRPAEGAGGNASRFFTASLLSSGRGFEAETAADIREVRCVVR
jgi:hypothetical protein